MSGSHLLTRANVVNLYSVQVLCNYAKEIKIRDIINQDFYSSVIKFNKVTHSFAFHVGLTCSDDSHTSSKANSSLVFALNTLNDAFQAKLCFGGFLVWFYYD